MVILPSIINIPEVNNDNSNSGLKAQRRKKQLIDRTEFVSGNRDTQSLYFSRVWEEPSYGCLDINICPSDNKGNNNLLTVEVLSPGIRNLNVDNNDSNSIHVKQKRK